MIFARRSPNEMAFMPPISSMSQSPPSSSPRLKTRAKRNSPPSRSKGFLSVLSDAKTNVLLVQKAKITAVKKSLKLNILIQKKNV